MPRACRARVCWRRLRDWQAAGAWHRLHALLLAELRAPGRLELTRAIADSAHVRALKGLASGPSPVDRGRIQASHPDRRGRGTAGGHPDRRHRNDVTQLVPLLDAIPPIRGRVGRPRRKPSMLVADRGYDHEKYRRLLRARGIRPMIARRGVAHGSGLGRRRWPVERTLAWLHQYRRLRARWERRADIHEGFLQLALLPDQLAVPATLIQLGVLQRLALPSDNAEAVQPDELQGTIRACHRNGRTSVSRAGWDRA